MIIDPYMWQRLPIVSLTPLTPQVVSVVVPRPPHYTFKAGQYAIVRVQTEAGQFIRQYSFASSPQDEQIELLIQREPGGTVSGWFHEHAAVGVEIEISQPFGDFALRDSAPRHILIAGRAGIAPFLSMIRDTDLEDNDLVVLYSARGKDDFCYPDLLRIRDTTLLDSTQDTRLGKAELAAYSQQESHFYLCGSKQFVDAIESVLGELDVPPARIQRERFTLQ